MHKFGASALCAALFLCGSLCAETFQVGGGPNYTIGGLLAGTNTWTGTNTFSNGATSAGSIKFAEDADNGTNTVTLIGPASTADITLTLPSSDGDAGQVLSTDGSGVMSWVTDSTASGANPTGTIGLSVVNGAAATFLRSDGAPALSQAIAPTWTGEHTYSNGATSAGYIKLREDADNGTNTVQLIAPASIADIVVTLPSATGTVALLESPSFTTPNLGTPSAGTLTNCTGLPVAGGGTGASTLNAALTNLGRRRIIKLADESVVNNILQSDDELTFTVAASTNYLFEFHLLVHQQAAATAGIQVAIDTPATPTSIIYLVTGPTNAINPQATLGTTAAAGGRLYGWSAADDDPINIDAAAAAGYLDVHVQGTLINSTNAGSITVRWAQVNTNATATIVKAGSWGTIDQGP